MNSEYFFHDFDFGPGVPAGAFSYIADNYNA
jgi:hypothetical protein